ncbi:MAG: Stp1/IreP family PP2C-type Ser/Thr phosphatase [Clostridia bacterium]|nr:Stp1/IreP family PP2C-type Ser/Thr phosphatase [Clostridia bacterium]
MIFAHRTDIGRRQSNQDFFHVPEENEKQLVIVADGMGGHRAGDVASRKAIEAILDFADASREEPSAQFLTQAISIANRCIFDIAAREGDCMGMGTTVVMAYVETDRIIYANVGDSRLYHFNGETLRQVTRDHSLVEELVRSGVITRRQAEVHPQRNILTRAVGTARFIKSDTGTIRWKRGDIIMLCSDGLHGSVSLKEMERIISNSSDMLEACDELTETALDNGSNDNITVVLVKNAGGAL